jgi:hypothetical protein
MQLRISSVIFFVFAAAGFALLLFSLFGFLADLVRWLYRPRNILSRASSLAARAARRKQPESFMTVEFSWLMAFLIAGVVTVLLWFVLEGAAVQPVALGTLLVPLLIRSWMVRQKSREASNEIRQFLTELRLQLSAGGTLRPALQAVAAYGPPNIGRLLRSRLAGQDNGAQVLRFIAEDTSNRWLEDIASRAEAAQSGMLNMDEAVAQSISRITEEMDTEIREQLQQIPTRLIVIVAPLILGPTLAVWVFPIVSRLFANLAGTTFMGTF